MNIDTNSKSIGAEKTNCNQVGRWAIETRGFLTIKKKIHLLSLPQDTEAGSVLGYDLSLADSGGAVCCVLIGQLNPQPSISHVEFFSRSRARC